MIGASISGGAAGGNGRSSEIRGAADVVPLLLERVPEVDVPELLVPLDELLRPEELVVPDFVADVDDEGDVVDEVDDFVDVFAVVDDFGVCAGSSSP
ncbi:MAG UNVERIFIED_CONTAM: hypothetical protein LVR18_41290 [Planctomycetaceae bacterium]